jgi:hypothetical protein
MSERGGQGWPGSAQPPSDPSLTGPPYVVKRTIHPAVVIGAGVGVLLTICLGLGLALALVAPSQTPTGQRANGGGPVGVQTLETLPAAGPDLTPTTTAPAPDATPSPTPPPPTTTKPATTAPVTTHTTARSTVATTRTTTKAPSLCGAPANPYGYNFCGGATISNPPSDICSYLSCIANFWNGRGYIEQCNDGKFSKSGGIQGSCSYHGGNRRPLYR